MPSKDMYYYSHFAPEVRTHLEAGAFRALCQHLSDRSEHIQNIDLMIVAGFGRNCLAKWLVKEARHLSSDLEHTNPKDALLLDAFGHSQATREVYGCDFFRWKKKYPQKATFEQMQRYQESEHIHAVHKEDKMLKTGMTVAMTEEFNSKFKMRLEAGAFRSLLQHLSERSDVVQNIDVMTTAGFCRNCLAKWLVVEARKLSATIKGVCQDSYTDEEKIMVQNLDAFGYDEAAEYVYGVAYPEWKAAHAKKASDKQMALYKASIPIHAKHDKAILEPLCDKEDATVVSSSVKDDQSRVPMASAESRSTPTSPVAKESIQQVAAPEAKKDPLLSDVCCEDLDATDVTCVAQTPSFRTPPPPKVNLSLKVGILTVSDRAANGEYENGDLSGPAVEQAINDTLKKLNGMRNELDETRAQVSFCVKAIVEDEMDQIISNLHEWCGNSEGGLVCDVIFTTGGTGFSPRDVTPEATLEVIEKEASGLMSFVTSQCAAIQPLSVLSRGTCGVSGNSLIANLPGNPAAVGQVMEILLPLLLHAIKDLKEL